MGDLLRIWFWVSVILLTGVVLGYRWGSQDARRVEGRSDDR